MLRPTRAALAVFLLLCLAHSRSQLILDDVAEDDEDLSQGGHPHPSQEPSDPMTKLLQWGVDNTDKNSLAERAKAIREGRAQPQKLDMEVMDALFGGKVKFLQTCVKGIHEAVSSGDEDRIVEALHELEEVTDIDNANDLDHETVGGLDPVIGLLTHSSSRVRTAALWVVGTTVQSNPTAQKLLISKKDEGHDVLHLILLPLREAAGSKLEAADPKLLSKALYALSTLVRGCHDAQQAFADMQGPKDLVNFAAVVAALPNGAKSDSWLPVKRKVVALIGDLAGERADDAGASAGAQSAALRKIKSGLGGGGDQDAPSAAASVLAMLGASDRELQEKALVALLALLQDKTTASYAVAILQGPSGASKIDNTLKLARNRLARTGEEDDGASWEEVAVLAEELALTMSNATAGVGVVGSVA